MTGCRRVTIVSVALFAGACATGRFGPPTTTPTPKGTHTLKNLSVNERDATLQRARVWQPVDTPSLDLAAGPPLPSALRIGGELTCTFVFPDKPLSGSTPKFRCEVRPDDVVKVKYGKNNGEVYAEIAASRLFWVLGFKADRMYPTRVTCHGCPGDPFAASKADWHLGKPEEVGQRVFDPAAIERPAPGSAIDVPVAMAGREGSGCHVREGDGAQYQHDGPGRLVGRGHLAGRRALRGGSPQVSDRQSRESSD
jgi:hypothetical protein